MKTTTTSPLALATTPSGSSLVGEAFEALTESFERFCLTAGIESLMQMMNEECDPACRRTLRARP